MTKVNTTKLGEKIKKGVDLAFKRLVVERQKDDGELVFSIDGKIVRIKARDLLK